MSYLRDAAAIALSVPAAMSSASIAYAGLNGLPQQDAAFTGAYIGLIVNAVLLLTFLAYHYPFIHAVGKGFGLLALWLIALSQHQTPRPLVQQNEPQPTRVSLKPRTVQNTMLLNKHQELSPLWQARKRRSLEAFNTIEGDADVLDSPRIDDADAAILLQRIRQGLPHSFRPVKRELEWSQARWQVATDKLVDAGVLSENKQTVLEGVFNGTSNSL